MKKSFIKKLIISTLLVIFTIFSSIFVFPSSSYAYTANKAWMEFRANGEYRVFVEYTVIEIKELRTVYIDFKTKKEAENFYFNLLKGADFYLSDSSIKFSSSSEEEPW